MVSGVKEICQKSVKQFGAFRNQNLSTRFMNFIFFV